MFYVSANSWQYFAWIDEIVHLVLCYSEEQHLLNFLRIASILFNAANCLLF